MKCNRTWMDLYVKKNTFKIDTCIILLWRTAICSWYTIDVFKWQGKGLETYPICDEPLSISTQCRAASLRPRNLSEITLFISPFLCVIRRPIRYCFCTVRYSADWHSCNMNFTSCLQSSDLSFGDNGGSRFDSPESNKLWNLRVSLIARLGLTSHHWLNFCVIVTRGLREGGGGGYFLVTG